MKTPEAPIAHRPGGVDWSTLLFIATYHLLLLVGLPLYLVVQTPSWTLLGGTAILLIGSMLGITAGYHRLYAHRTYRVLKPVEWVLLFFGTLAVQGSVLRWAHDHRRHHSHLDTEEDPYETPKGFWHSHLLWMFKESPVLDARYLGDLQENRLLVFQHRNYEWLLATTNLAAVGAVGWIAGDFVGAFVIAFLLRLFVAHHSTWFINSLAHLWGSKPYSTEHSAVNNFILALLTYGEGYHNFHHTFASDYRNGIRWYQFDPPKYLIWMMNKLGLASDLKRTDLLMVKKRLVQTDSKLLIEHLNDLPPVDASAFVGAVERVSSRLSEAFLSAKRVMDRCRSLDRTQHRIEVQELRETVRALNRSIKQDMKTWRRLCRLILDLPAHPVRTRTR
jgi:stearoyl-CoA desaturase (delta-9 desaturase)